MKTLEKENEVPKHKKKARKSVKKSDHKHLYEACLVYNETISSGTRCKICGKIGDYKFFEFEKIENSSFRRLLPQDEVLKKYENLELYDVNGVSMEKPE